MAARSMSNVMRCLTSSQQCFTPRSARFQLAKLPSSRSIASPHRYYSTTTEDAPPPFLSKLKGDLKTAMRAKDVPRLSVLRAIMAANLNASKTSTPIKTDVQLVGLLRKLQRDCQQAIDDAKAAGREDLVEKEQKQVNVFQEYIDSSGLQFVDLVELQAMVQNAIEATKASGTEAKAQFGDIMKQTAQALTGKDFNKKQLADIVKEMIGKQ